MQLLYSVGGQVCLRSRQHQNVILFCIQCVVDHVQTAHIITVFVQQVFHCIERIGVRVRRSVGLCKDRAAVGGGNDAHGLGIGIGNVHDTGSQRLFALERGDAVCKACHAVLIVLVLLLIHFKHISSSVVHLDAAAAGDDDLIGLDRTAVQFLILGQYVRILGGVEVGHTDAVRIALILGQGFRDHLIVLVRSESSFIGRNGNIHVFLHIADIVQCFIADRIEVCGGQIQLKIRIPLADLSDHDVDQYHNCHKDYGDRSCQTAVFQLFPVLQFFLLFFQRSLCCFCMFLFFHW